MEDISESITPAPRKRYLLEALISRCDPRAPMPDDLRIWSDTPAVGREHRPTSR